MNTKIEPKPMVVAETLNVGTPTDDHTGRVFVGYTLTDGKNQAVAQGTIEFEVSEAKLARKNPLFAVAEKIGVKILKEKKSKTDAPKEGDTPEGANTPDDAPGSVVDEATGK